MPGEINAFPKEFYQENNIRVPQDAAEFIQKEMDILISEISSVKDKSYFENEMKARLERFIGILMRFKSVKMVQNSIRDIEWILESTPRFVKEYNMLDAYFEIHRRLVKARGLLDLVGV